MPKQKERRWRSFCLGTPYPFSPGGRRLQGCSFVGRQSFADISNERPLATIIEYGFPHPQA